MKRYGWIVAVCALGAAGFLPVFAPGPTAYQRELAQIGRDLDAQRDPLRRTGLLYRRASLTADFADFRTAERAIDAAFVTAGPTPDLLLLRANFNFKLHRLDAAERDLRLLDERMPGVTSLRADLAFQRGRYDEARAIYSAEVARADKWDDLARLAYLQSRTGDVPSAETTYARAQQEISAKELRSFAWVELQRGILDLERKRYEPALTHYRRADRAYSGYWLIEEHIAEVLDLMGRTKEARAMYEKIIESTHNPEYVNALARITGRDDLYAEADRLNTARFALYPEAAIGHLIRDSLARPHARPDLVSLARRNYDLRPNAESKLLLARAYLKANEHATALRLIREIETTTPWRTTELADTRAACHPERSEGPRNAMSTAF